MKKKRICILSLAACAVLCVVCVVLAVVTGLQAPTARTLYGGSARYAVLARTSGGYLTATRDNELCAVTDEGEVLWADATYTNSVAALCVHGDIAYAASGNKIYAVSVSDGSKREAFTHYDNGGTQVVFSAVADIATDAGGGLLAVSHGANKSRHFLTLLDTASGATVFHTSVGVTADTIAIYDGKVYLGSDNGSVRAYDYEGKATDLVRMEDDVATLTVSGGFVYAADDSGHVARIPVDGGEVTYGGAGTGNALTAPRRIAADEKNVYVASGDGNLYVLDRALKHKNTVKAGNGLADIVLYGDRLCAVVSGKGIVSYARASLPHNSGVWCILSSVAAALTFIGCIVLAAVAANPFRRGLAKVGKTLWRHKTAYLMLAPVFALLLVFGFYPVAVAAVRAFTDWSSTSLRINFIGFDNFRMMIREGYFLTGVKNLLIFLASYVVKILTVPLLVAFMVYCLARGRSKYVYRYLFVLPMVVPSVVSALMWKNIYDPNFGLLNKVLETVGLGRYQRGWLSDPHTAIPALIFVGFPFIDPFSFLIYYSAMVNIPASTLEAARLDGAGGARRFFSIILPAIASQIKVLLVLGFINQIQDFNLILLLTNGGPGTSTYVPGYELYLNATSFGRYGYACALGLVMFVVIFIGTAVMNRIKVNTDVE